jgi:hypothetical protein
MGMPYRGWKSFSLRIRERSVGSSGLRPLGAVKVLTRQNASSEATIREPDDAEAVGGLPGVALVRAVEQAEVVLARDRTRHAELVGECAEHRDAEGVLVAQAPILDETRVEQPLDREQLALEDGVARLARRKRICMRHRPVDTGRREREAAKDGAVARRPVELVQVDVAAAQALDRGAA